VKISIYPGGEPETTVIISDIAPLAKTRDLQCGVQDGLPFLDN
jgi:hypothetical protein